MNGTYREAFETILAPFSGHKDGGIVPPVTPAATESHAAKVCHGLFSRDLVPLRGCRTCAHHEGCIPIQEELARPMPAKEPRSKCLREIKPGVFVDAFDVLVAWKVENPALADMIQKTLQLCARGHKTREQDLADIVASAIRAKEIG